MEALVNDAPVALAAAVDAPAQSTLSAALVSGTAYTSLAVVALTVAVVSGDNIEVSSGANSQTFVASAAAAVGATAIAVTSLVANFAYPVGSVVFDRTESVTVTRASASTGWPGDASGPPSANFRLNVSVPGSTSQVPEIMLVTGGQGTTTLTVTRAVEPIQGQQVAQAFGTTAVMTPTLTAGGLAMPGNPMTTLNDLIVGGASGAPTRLGAGSAGQVLTVLPQCSAVLLNGTSGGVTTPYGQPALATFSFLAWIKPISPAASTYGAVFSTSAFYSTATGFALAYNVGAGTTGGGFQFALNATSRVNAIDPATLASLAGVWQCYVGTYDGTTMTLYRNGASVATAANSGSCVASGTAAALGLNSAGYYFDGTMGHTALFPGVVLTAAQAAALYDNTTMTEVEYESYVEGLSPNLYYPLQDPTGTTATNSGSLGSSYDGTYTGGYTLLQQGPVTGGTAHLGWL